MAGFHLAKGSLKAAKKLARSWAPARDSILASADAQNGWS